MAQVNIKNFNLRLVGIRQVAVDGIQDLHSRGLVLLTEIVQKPRLGAGEAEMLDVGENGVMSAQLVELEAQLFVFFLEPGTCRTLGEGGRAHVSTTCLRKRISLASRSFVHRVW